MFIFKMEHQFVQVIYLVLFHFQLYQLQTLTNNITFWVTFTS